MSTTNLSQVRQMLLSLSSEELNEVAAEARMLAAKQNVKGSMRQEEKFDLFLEHVPTEEVKLLATRVNLGHAEFIAARLNRALVGDKKIVFTNKHSESNLGKFDKKLIVVDNFNRELKADYPVADECSEELYLLLDSYLNSSSDPDYYKLVEQSYKLFVPDWMVD